MDLQFQVSVRCMTYNQSRYIKETLNGFCMQHTDFPFVCIVMDDASTDGEQIVIQKYLGNHFDLGDKEIVRREETDDFNMIFAQHKTNRNCFFSVFFLKYNHYNEWKQRKLKYISSFEKYAKYLAFCEGDDYWCDSSKLQTQFDFLENHRDYSMVYTDSIVVDALGKTIGKKKTFECSTNATKDLLLEGNFIVTATTFCHNYWDKWEEEKKKIPFKLKMGDYPMWIYFSTIGKIKKISKWTTAYRFLPESASHTSDVDKLSSFIDNAERITQFFNDLYHIGVSDKKIEIRHLKGKTRLMAKISRKAFIDHWKLLLLKNPISLFDLRLSAIAFVRIVLNISR